MTFAYVGFVILAGVTVATSANVTQDILSQEGSLALQAALLVAVIALGTVIVTLHRSQTRADKARYDSLMDHHEAFAEDVRKERTYWQDTMVSVVKDNTKAMSELREMINAVRRR